MEKLKPIGLFESCLCILVVWGHVVSEPVTRYSSYTLLGVLFYLSQKIATFAVPAFVFSSGLKYFYKYRTATFRYKPFLLSRVRKILLPYLIWVCIYYAYFIHIEYFPFQFSKLMYYIVTGKIVSPFYFIILIIQFYLLMPVWLAIVKRIRFLPAFICALAVSVFSRYVMPAWVDWTFFDRILPSYGCFWILGCYMGASYETFMLHLRKYFSLYTFFLCLFSVVHLYLSILMFQGKFFYFFAEPVHIAFCILLIVIFYVVLDWEKLAGICEHVWIQKLHQINFYIYLSHSLAIFVINRYMDDAGMVSTAARFMLRFLFVFGASILLSRVFYSTKRSGGAILRH